MTIRKRVTSNMTLVVDELIGYIQRCFVWFGHWYGGGAGTSGKKTRVTGEEDTAYGGLFPTAWMQALSLTVASSPSNSPYLSL